MVDVFSNIRVRQGDRERSLRWYQDQVRKLGTVLPEQLLKGTQMTNRLYVGGMYMFRYDPKTKEQLKYYDTFPLVLPFNETAKGFMGINVHYLPYPARFELLGNLAKLQTVQLQEDKRVRVSWSVLSNFAGKRFVRPCVKQYLSKHVESRFLKLQYEDWTTAALLPVERFKKEDKRTVWRDSRKQYGAI